MHEEDVTKLIKQKKPSRRNFMYAKTKTILAFMIAISFLLVPSTLAAPGDKLEQNVTIPNQNLLFMVSSYGVDGSGLPVQCPSPQLFKNGTRTVYSYIPAEALQDISTVVFWYELDENGNVVGDEPVGVQEGVLGDGDLFVFNYSYNKGTTGYFAPVLLIQENGDWYWIAMGFYKLLDSSSEAPEPIECPGYPLYIN
jgi:hypothetical protein